VGSKKRGGDLQPVQETTTLSLDSLPAAGTDRASEISALDDALDALAKREPRRTKVIELRYFGGLSVEETAEALGVSPQTVLRDWPDETVQNRARLKRHS
jgi:RNA polymerase sigma-70 factor, ECF subfamily